MSATRVLTIDLGTSGVKASVVSASGTIMGSGRHDITTSFTDDGGAHQDPEAVWQATATACRAAVDAAGDAASIAAVIPTSQYSSIVPVDLHGRHVGPMIVWMDQRGAPKRLRGLPGAPRLGDSPKNLARWFQIHGLPPIEAGMSLNHMRWVRYGEPELYERTAKFVEPMDYLAARMTGRITANQCSAFMMLVIDNRRLGVTSYCDQLVEASGIDRSKLPELVEVGAVVGNIRAEVAAELGVGADAVVLSGFNDTQAGALGSGAFAGTHAGISLGTTGVITSHVASKKVDPRTSIYTVPSPIGGCHLVSAENGVAGVGVDHFLRTVVYADDAFSTASDADRYAAMNAAVADSPVGANGVVYLPWLRGSLAPVADRRMRGGFLNVGLDNDRHDLARAVFEGIALNFGRLKRPVERFVKREFTHFVVYGGGALSDLWMQILADVLDAPVDQLDEASHAVSVGAGLFALAKLGHIDEGDIASIPTVRRRFEPTPADARRYAEMVEWQSAVFKQTRPLFKTFNRR